MENVLTPLEQTEEKELVPYPKIEYDVIMEASLEKFKRKINQMIWQWREPEWGMNVATVGSWLRFYQAMVRWNIDKTPDNMDFLLEEEDLYEDADEE